MVDSGKMPVLELTSHMRGRPTRVWVFRDRIEWQPTPPGILSRGVVAAATDGGSELLDGGAGGEPEMEMEMLPIDTISSLGAERVGMHVRLSIVARGSTVQMDVSRSKAARVQEVLRALMSGEPPSGH